MTQEGIPPNNYTPGYIEYASPPDDVPHRKWKTWGIVFGILFIIAGVFSGCMGLIIPLTLLVPANRGGINPRAIVPGILVYVAMSIALTWLGYGSLKMQRWVRPMVLISGVIAILMGIVTVIGMAVVIISQTMPNSGGAPVIVFVISLAFIFMITVVVPAIFVMVFYRPGMKLALEFYDPMKRWTDDKPIPVLGLAMLLLGYAFSILIATPRPVFPIFGTVLYGAPALACEIVLAATGFWLFWQVYRMRMVGWWGALGLQILMSVAYGMTLFRSDLEQRFRLAGFNEQELIAMRSIYGQPLALRLAAPAFMMAISLAYLLYVRRFFRASGLPEGHPSASST